MVSLKHYKLNIEKAAAEIQSYGTAAEAGLLLRNLLGGQWDLVTTYSWA